MESKTKTSKTQKTTLIADPFETAVEPIAAKKPAMAENAAAVKKPVAKRIVKAKVKAVEVDPFAEKATSSSVKKGAATPKSKAVTPEPKPKAKKAAKRKAAATVAEPDTLSEAPTLDAVSVVAVAEPEVALSPVFKALAEVSLPELKRENRARLQIQTPTRAYFYWSLKDNPWAKLRDSFGSDIGSYTLIIKLKNLTRETEEIHRADPDGSHWFDVEANSEYQAEIGFYAANRPYFRMVYSNTVATPRRSPSPRPASEARWTVTANKFAEVLDVAGFTRDAVDVAMAGDDPAAADVAAHTAFASMAGMPIENLYDIAAEDIRYALLALAAGTTLDELRGSVSPTLISIMQSTESSLTKPKALAALAENFEMDETLFDEEQIGPAVFGASSINFPRTLKPRNLTSRYNPISSVR